jgi:hypothetical protein
MPRALALLLALLSLTTSASSETMPGAPIAAQATPFAPGHTDNRLIRSLTGGRAVHSTALTCCKICSVGKACGETKFAGDADIAVGANPRGFGTQIPFRSHGIPPLPAIRIWARSAERGSTDRPSEPPDRMVGLDPKLEAVNDCY